MKPTTIVALVVVGYLLLGKQKDKPLGPIEKADDRFVDEKSDPRKQQRAKAPQLSRQTIERTFFAPRDPFVTFPELGPWCASEKSSCTPDSIPAWEQTCGLGDPWGGEWDSTKIEKAEKQYVAEWGFSPPQAFRDWVAKFDPCRAEEVAAHIRKFPPFPGEKMPVSELVKRQKLQAIARGLDAADQKAAEEQCKAALVLTGLFLGTAGGAATGGGQGAREGAKMGAKAGELAGKFC